MTSTVAKRSERAALHRRLLVTVAAAALIPASAPVARAEDDPVFRIEFKDGAVTPRRLEVPANHRLVLELHNVGETPAEFESRELRKEKVLAPGATSTLVIRTLDPGEYDFFDDFHTDAPPAVLVAK
jgi:cupredoxin-like protein